jgi:hypothetical protein
VVKGPAADATDTPQPWGLLCNTVMKMLISFFVSPRNGAPVEWNWQGKTKVLGGRGTCPCATSSTTNLTWTDPGSNSDFLDERPATNRLSLGTAYQFLLLYSTIIVNILIPTVWHWKIELIYGNKTLSVSCFLYFEWIVIILGLFNQLNWHKYIDFGSARIYYKTTY